MSVESKSSKIGDTILVVDDSRFFRNVLQTNLSKHGYTVHTADNGEEAIELCNKLSPDLILLDVNMPGMNGMEVCKIIKSSDSTSDIPVVFMTGDEKTESKVQGFEAGGSDYIVKSAAEEETVTRVKTHIKIAKLQKDLKNSRDELVKQLKLIEEQAETERQLHTTIQSQQAKLQHSDRMAFIGQLSESLAHEINTPVQFIFDNLKFVSYSTQSLYKLIDSLEKIVKKTADDEHKDELEKIQNIKEEIDYEYICTEIPEALEQSLEGMNRIAEIVKTMKDFSKSNSGHKQSVYIEEAIQRALMMTQNYWKYVAEVQTEFSSDPQLVQCVPEDFNQVIINVVINAAHAIEEVAGNKGKLGLITIKTSYDNEFAEISIADNGIGVADENKHRIFDPFFTTKDVGKGTGQGLANVYSVVVEKHGGSIDFDTKVGAGTTFRIRLPFEKAVLSVSDSVVSYMNKEISGVDDE